MMPGAPDILRACRAHGVTLQIRGEDLRWWAPPGVVTDDLAALLRANARQLIALIERERAPARAQRTETESMSTKPTEPPASTMPAAIQSMLEKIASGLSASAEAGRQRAKEIVAAAEHYAAAYEQKVLAEFSARLTGTPADTRGADEAALALLERVNALPELQPKGPRLVPQDTPPAAVSAVPGTGSEPVLAASGEWTRVRIAAARGRVIVLGGGTSTKLLAWLQPRVGRPAEWFSVKHGDRGDVMRAAGALRAGGVALAVAIGSAFESSQLAALQSAARNHNVALAVAAGSSVDSIARALDELEASLAA